MAAVLAYLFFGYLRPMLYKMMGRDEKGNIPVDPNAIKEEEEQDEEEEEDNDEDAIVELGSTNGMSKELHTTYEINLDMAKQLAISDPKIVANVIKKWVNNE
jgi:flagellar M-ring protein FliF